MMQLLNAAFLKDEHTGNRSGVWARLFPPAVVGECSSRLALKRQ